MKLIYGKKYKAIYDAMFMDLLTKSDLEKIIGNIEERERHDRNTFRLGYLALLIPSIGAVAAGMAVSYNVNVGKGATIAAAGLLVGGYFLSRMRKCAKREEENYRKLREFRNRLTD